MWVIITIYLIIGVANVLHDFSQPIINRPLYLSRRKSRLAGIITKVILWPFFLSFTYKRLRRKGRRDLVVLDASEEVVNLYNQGTIASTKGQYEKAIELFTKVLNQNPKLVPVYINRGNAYGKLGAKKFADFDDSSKFYDEKQISDYSKAIEFEPTNSQVFYLRGVAKYAQGNYKGALSDIQKAKSLGYKDIDLRLEQTVARYVEKNL